MVDRLPWNGFPDVVLAAANEAALLEHPLYRQAKADVAAAKRMAAGLLKGPAVDRVKRLGIDPACLVPVHAQESDGYNRIPAAFAQLLAERLGLEVDAGIIQANVVSHTGANEWARIARPALFAGKVVRGRTYIVVDDFAGQGGTLANLRGFIGRRGGRVVAAVTLTGKPGSEKLAVDPAALEALRAKHGKGLENWWRRSFGHSLAELTQGEARCLLRVKDADEVRANLAEAGLEGND